MAPPPDPPPRGARARQAILNAADDMLVEEGFAGLTIEGIASRAGVAKQTIYRWWPSKVELLLDGLLADVDDELGGVDTGSTAGDVRHHLASLARFLADAPPGRVLLALIGEAQHSTDVATELRRRYVDPRRAHDRQMLVRGVERGEVDPAIDLDAILDALEGPIYYRALIGEAARDPRFIDALVDRVLPTLLSSSSATAARAGTRARTG